MQTQRCPDQYILDHIRQGISIDKYLHFYFLVTWWDRFMTGCVQESISPLPGWRWRFEDITWRGDACIPNRFLDHSAGFLIMFLDNLQMGTCLISSLLVPINLWQIPLLNFMFTSLKISLLPYERATLDGLSCLDPCDSGFCSFFIPLGKKVRSGTAVYLWEAIKKAPCNGRLLLAKWGAGLTTCEHLPPTNLWGLPQHKSLHDLPQTWI